MKRITIGRQHGLTLTELLLATVLLIVLAGSVVVNFMPWRTSNYLPQGSNQFQTLLMMARAEAANQGRRVQVSFQPQEDQSVRVVILWEPQPLKEPGRFVEYQPTWADAVSAELVRVTACQVRDSLNSLPAGPDAAADPSTERPLDAILFYPDGSVDSAVIELASTSDSDPRRAVIEIDGLGGSIHCTLLQPSEIEEFYQQQGYFQPS